LPRPANLVTAISTAPHEAPPLKTREIAPTLRDPLVHSASPHSERNRATVVPGGPRQTLLTYQAVAPLMEISKLTPRIRDLRV
jgi:hypothetical protein